MGSKRVEVFYSCRTFECRYGAEGVGVMKTFDKFDASEIYDNRPICDKCGQEMLTRQDEEIENELNSLGVNRWRKK